MFRLGMMSPSPGTVGEGGRNASGVRRA